MSEEQKPQEPTEPEANQAPEACDGSAPVPGPHTVAQPDPGTSEAEDKAEEAPTEVIKPAQEEKITPEAAGEEKKPEDGNGDCCQPGTSPCDSP
jgi:hypothetical protein